MSDDARAAALTRIHARRAAGVQILTMLGIAIVVTLLWLLTGRGYFWPAWVYLGLLFSIVGIVSHLYGSRGVSEAQLEAEMKRGS